MPTLRRRVDVFLVPGELTVHKTAVNVKTIVGSCVAVCLFDRQAHVGGVNHYLLPHPSPGDPPDTRFGDVAIARLIEKMCQAGGVVRRLAAAVIGGGHPVSAMGGLAVGDANVHVALEVLRARGISVRRQETGGDHGRKLLFNTHTGELLVRDLRSWPARQQEEAEA